MLYCEHCMRLCEISCLSCKRKKLRLVRENDPVHLICVNGMTAAIIEDVLQENKIPFLKRGVLGSALTVYLGQMGEQYDFFVPYAARNRALEITEEFDPERQQKADE